MFRSQTHGLLLRGVVKDHVRLGLFLPPLLLIILVTNHHGWLVILVIGISDRVDSMALLPMMGCHWLSGHFHLPVSIPLPMPNF